MSKEFARAFYNSRQWIECKNAYIQSVGGLCEKCLAKGIYKPGKIVHHKVYLTPENIDDYSVSLNWENLELLCQDCHTNEHLRKAKRYRVDEFGRVSGRDTTT